MEKDGVPVSDLVEGVEFKPEISGDVAELHDLLAGKKPVKEPVAEPETEPEPVAEQEWIHEPTGKAFKTEGELAIHESGYKSNQIGELRAQLKAAEEIAVAKGEQPKAEPPTLTQEQMEKNLLTLALRDTGVKVDDADSSYGLVAKIAENLIGAYDGVVGEKFNEMKARLDAFESASTEQTALQASGLDMAKIQSTLEKHPYLKLLKPKERLAVIADLASKGSGEKPPTNALRDALQPNVADHVEGSANIESVESQESAIMKRAADMSDEDLLRFLGEETAKGGMPWDI